MDFQSHYGDDDLNEESISNDNKSKKQGSSFPNDDETDSGRGLFSEDNKDSEGVGNFYTRQSLYNNMEDQISIVERTSKKLMPVYQEVLKRIKTIEKKTKEIDALDDHSQEDFEGSDIDSKVDIPVNANGNKKRPSAKPKKQLPKGPQVDLRHILGFLNQTEWIQNLNIGNIMQIAPLKLMTWFR